VCRGYITSGYPLYASEFGAIQFDWTIAHKAAASDRNWILSQASDPTRDWHSVLASNDWLATTLSDPLVRKSLVLGAAGLILDLISVPWLRSAGGCRFRRGKQETNARIQATSGPAVAGRALRTLADDLLYRVRTGYERHPLTKGSVSSFLTLLVNLVNWSLA
jgi:hypothetical protein